MEELYRGTKFVIYKDQVFGDFQCIGLGVKVRTNTNILVKCLHCGKEKSEAPTKLINNVLVKCRCQRRVSSFTDEDIQQQDKFIGSKVGRWTVVSRAKELAKPNVEYAQTYNCVCECGNEAEVKETFLSRFKITSCGCNRTKHSLSGSKLYGVWSGIHSRCYDNKVDSYCRYGAKGIKVCDEWHKAINFLNWALESGYKDGLTIERKDPYGNYEPDNCCWIPQSDQARNCKKRRDNTSGYTGVYKFGGYYSANWQENNKSKSKSFSIKKHGDELAELMAVEYRAHMIDMLKLQGVYYGEKHGQ